MPGQSVAQRSREGQDEIYSQQFSVSKGQLLSSPEGIYSQVHPGDSRSTFLFMLGLSVPVSRWIRSCKTSDRHNTTWRAGGRALCVLPSLRSREPNVYLVVYRVLSREPWQRRYFYCFSKIPSFTYDITSVRSCVILNTLLWSQAGMDLCSQDK